MQDERVTPGNWTGFDFNQLTSRPDAVMTDGTVANNEYFESNDSSPYRPGTDSFSFCIVFRIVRLATDLTDNYLMSIHDGDGWHLSINDDKVTFTIEANGNSASITSEQLSFSDGAMHYIAGFRDIVTNKIYLKSNLFAELEADASSVVDTLTVSLSDLYLNKHKNIANSGQSRLSIAHVMYTNDTGPYDPTFPAPTPNAEECYNAVEEVMVLPGAFKKYDNDARYVIASRTASLGLPINERYQTIFVPQTSLAMGYNPIIGENKLGLYVNNEITNLIPHTHLSTGAVNVNMTADDEDDRGPDGFNHATRYTVTSNNGYQARVASVSELTEYTGRITMVWDFVFGGSDTYTGEFIAYDESNGAEIASIVTGPADPSGIGGIVSGDPYSLTFTTPAGCTSVSLRLQTDSASPTADVTAAWDWQLQAGPEVIASVRTSGSAATADQPVYHVSSSTGNWIPEAQAELQVKFLTTKLPSSGSTDLHYVFDTVDTSDRRALYFDATGSLYFLVNDSAGSNVSTLFVDTISEDVEYLVFCQWSETSNLGDNSVRAWTDGTEDKNKPIDGAAFTSGNGYTDKLYFGMNGLAADTALDGFITKLYIYPRAFTS
jgi:hypothetical protein